MSPGDTEFRRPCCMDRICGARFSVEAPTFSTCIDLGSLTIPRFSHFPRNPLFSDLEDSFSAIKVDSMVTRVNFLWKLLSGCQLQDSAYWDLGTALAI